jgi:integrase
MPRRANGEGTYRRKGKGWQAAIRLGGQRYWVSGRTRRECQEKVMALLLRHQQGSLSPPSRLTLGEWASLWLRQGEGRWRPTTLERRRQVMGPLLERVGKLRLVRLMPLHLAAALEELRRRGMGSRSLELCWATLHACLEDARKMGIIGDNACARTPRPRHQPREGRVWTLADMRCFLQAALEDSRPLALMLALSLLTGLRLGELLGLRWDDLDLEGGTLTVRRAVAWAEGTWHEGPPKSKTGERTVALPALALSLLGRLPRASVHLFWSQRPPARGAISRLMAELCQRAGVPRRPAHYLRHCHASLLVHLGVDIKSAQRRLVHATADMTLNTYAHHLPGQERAIARALDQALSG